MLLSFPPDFFFGVSTAAAQIETAGDHTWRGLRALDGRLFERTTDHEQHRLADAERIARFGTIYRCGVDWSRLQPEPMAKFVPSVVAEYREMFDFLAQKGVRLMFVLHHFCHPNWFEQKGGFTKEENIPFFINYTQQCIKHFGEYAAFWNTFNEPNVFVMNGWILGNFPPRKKGRYWTANRILDNMGKAHDIARTLIQDKFDAPVGISLNTAIFEATHWLGVLPAAFVRWWFLRRAAKPFEACDFWGLSYYAHVPFAPFPKDYVQDPGYFERRNWPHDDMWGYRPEGLGMMIRRFWKRYKKPIIITENGICTEDSDKRVESLRDYLRICHQSIQEGVDLRGYIHWSAWDNFEWHLGCRFRFGLLRVDFDTMTRENTSASYFYEKIAAQKALEV